MIKRWRRGLRTAAAAEGEAKRGSTIACAAAAQMLWLAATAAGAEAPLVLLLSGGGARGAAHVGVLKVLEEEHVAPDLIVGTSMGALVGGLYASGLTAEEIERTMLATDWNAVFQDRPDRALETFRRKRDEREYQVRGRLRLDRLHPSFPLGVVVGHRIVELLREKTAPVAAIGDFADLPIPFRAVATDLESGEAVVLDHGDLALAMRASMAVPGVFTPVNLHGRLLIDGGIAENLAIEVAERDGPARILAVDIATPPHAVHEIDSAVRVVNQAMTLLMARENRRQIARLGADDVFIQPKLGSFSSAAFAQAADAIRVGEEAARASIADLRRLALTPAEYAAWRAGRRPAASADGLLTAVAVTGPDTHDARAVRRRLDQAVGREVDREALQHEVERARATGLYEGVDLVVLSTGEGEVRAELTLAPQERGTDALLFGLRLADDFEGSTDFDLGARWVGHHLTRGDLEARVDLRLGERQAATVDLYRPLGVRHALFVDVAGGFREEPFAVYRGESVFFRLRRRDLFATVDLGAAAGRWGEVRLGLEQNWSRLRPSSDQGVDLGDLSFEETLARALFGVDTSDDVTFPSRGALVRAEVDHVLASGLGEQGVTYASLLAQQAWSAGAWRMVAGLEWADTLDGEPGFPHAVGGGLFRLSGFAEDELRGSRLAIGGLRLAREVGGAAARNPVFVGASLEVGTVLPEAAGLTWSEALVNGSLYLSVDSWLGPVFVYVGFAERERPIWGFTLGSRLFRGP